MLDDAKNRIPTFNEMMNPLIMALKELGGSGTINEINEKVYKILDLPDNVLDVPHGDNGNQSEVAYRLAWTRTYLKKYGVLENSSRGVWALRKDAIDINNIDEREVVNSVRGKFSDKLTDPNVNDDDGSKNDKKFYDDEIEPWRDTLMNTLKAMDPMAFERLAQRILRESGFVEVEVTKATGDGGIDGKGIVRLNGILSFHTIFQCKRYSGSVSSNLIRDFRGAMQGRADKGLFITTGKFTRDAIHEAKRDGAPPIDLVDGQQLIDLLRDLELGVKVVKDYEVDLGWFDKI